MTAHDVLHQLLDATPSPPQESVGSDRLLAGFASMLEQRRTILDQIHDRLDVTDQDQPLLDELTRRQIAWLAALERARIQLGDHRIAAAKLRAYAT